MRGRLLAAACVFLLLCATTTLVRGQQLDNGQLRERLLALEDKVGALESEIRVFKLKERARATQFTYNRNLDKSVALGIVHRYSKEYNETVDAVVATFCPESSFEYWVAYSQGALWQNVTDRAAIRNLYELLGGVYFLNVSRHLVTQDIETYYLAEDGLPRVEFNASIMQWVQTYTKLNQTDDNEVPLPRWTENLSYYRNTYREMPDGSVCISRFISEGSSGRTYPDAVFTPIDFSPDRY